jgi:hypothetical protein
MTKLIAITLIVLALAIGSIGSATILQGCRIRDLEQRVTTFETVRIEMVAPPEGVSPLAYD